ncbi:UDP-glucosyltransferase 2-like isoform X1 [Onthophagus taurus]|uniref:UDP-glucosyltransferase 2-like isoform X1 n=2 Tax=Onthophagus taurus TaxID=166361 RepID=UPI0039BE1A5F
MNQFKKKRISFQLLLVLNIFIFFTSCSDGAKILAFFPFSAYSHINMIKVMVKPLLDRGHEIDLVSFYPLNIKHKGYSDIDISACSPVLKNSITLSKSLVADIDLMQDMFNKYGHELMDAVLKSPQLRKLKNSTKKYDLILRHILLSDPLEIYSHIFGAPSIGMITSVNLPWSSDLVGIPDNPAYIATFNSPHGEIMSFSERAINTIIYTFQKYEYWKVQKRFTELIWKYFGRNMPRVEELLEKTSLILCNSHYTIHQSRSMPPNFIEIGGVHIPEENNFTLPKHLQLGVDSSKEGIIYFSFGSTVKSTIFNRKILSTMFEALGKQPHKVFWKGEKEDILDDLKIPDNIIFEPWMPQLNMLCNPNTKLFIAHGGLFGVQEAIYCGIPILGIPFFADQASNIQFLVEKNVARLIYVEDIAEGNKFEEYIETLLKPQYKQNAENLSKLFRDRPMSPIKTAIYWIEYVIKYNGAPHLKSSVTKLYWYQYYLLDVIGVFLIIFAFINFILYLICKQLIKLVLNLEYIYYVCNCTKKKIKFG